MILIEFPKDPERMDYAGYGRHPFKAVPVRLHIAGLELLTPNRESLSSYLDNIFVLPLPELASGGMYALERAWHFGHAGYELDSYGQALIFQREGSNIILHSSLADKTVRVRYKALHDAWKRFVDEVREFIRREFPEWMEHPTWAPTLSDVPPWKEWVLGKDAPFDEEAGLTESWYHAFKDELIYVDAIEM